MKTFFGFLDTIKKVDRKSLLVCVAYNLIKQMMNVFYGVYFLRLILVHIETDRDMGAVLWVLAGMLAINMIFYFGDSHFKHVYAPAFEAKLQQSVYESIAERAASVAYEEYNRPEFLDLYRRLLDNTAPCMIKMWNSVGTIFGLAEAFVLILFYVIRVDWFAVLLSVVPLFYSYIVAAKAAKCRMELDRALALPGRKKEYAKRVFYLPQYAKELKTTAVSGILQKIYEEGAGEAIRLYRKFGKKTGFFNFIELIIGDVVIIMLPIAYVACRMLTGNFLLIGDFIGIAQSITTFGWDIKWFFDEIINMKSASLYIKEYQEYCRTYQIRSHKQTGPGKAGKFTVSCQNVAYAYPGGNGREYALHDINVTIHSGETIAVVGENGAGKTTFTHVLSRLFACTGGRVLLNGVDIGEYGEDELQEFFGVVYQDFHLFPMSVRENVCVNGSLGSDKVREAIRSMGLEERIRDLDMQVTKEFSDDGLVLSGGEEQRLALARVVANRYPFVILDEPTSALDPVTEREINQYVMEAMAGEDRTLLFISHKLSTTRLVDRILVFRDGTIIEEGNHSQLMEKRGHYYEMYTAQKSMYGEKGGSSPK